MSAKQRIQNAVARLPIQIDQRTLSLAESYLQRSIGKFPNFKTMLEILCLDLAMTKSNKAFCQKDVVEIFKYDVVEYVDEFQRLAKLLGVEIRKRSLEDIAILFGSVNGADYCYKVLAEYKESCKKSMSNIEFKQRDWKSQELILAVFSTTMKALKVKIDKMEFSFIGGNSKLQKNYSKEIESVCKEFLGTLKTSGRSKDNGHLSKRARTSKDQEKTRAKEHVEEIESRSSRKTRAAKDAPIIETPTKPKLDSKPSSLQKPKKTTPIKKANILGMVIKC